ncbi:hypothetical protein H9P43_009220 [Blastocladiella emersonii ATCC 22665]|nr:hypothetical protein H9P43_009220 [Blastocladiella emersonii ATCC 22665]
MAPTDVAANGHAAAAPAPAPAPPPAPASSAAVAQPPSQQQQADRSRKRVRTISDAAMEHRAPPPALRTAANAPPVPAIPAAIAAVHPHATTTTMRGVPLPYPPPSVASVPQQPLAAAPVPQPHPAAATPAPKPAAAAAVPPPPPPAAAAHTGPAWFAPERPPPADWSPTVLIPLPFSPALVSSSRTLASASRALAAATATSHHHLPPQNHLDCLHLRVCGYAAASHASAAATTTGGTVPSALRVAARVELVSLLPRSVCAALHAHGVLPAIQFDILGSVPPGERPRPRVPSRIPLVEEMKHLRKSAFIPLACIVPGGEPWELHLKVNATGHQLDGYLVPTARMHAILEEAGLALLRARRLPLVLDLDDTVVRVALTPGDLAAATSAQAQAQAAPPPGTAPPPRPNDPRAHRLPCGKHVLVASDAPRFLDWARDKFEVSVCSLGEQLYVGQVCALLDPPAPPSPSSPPPPPRIPGPRFSARQEYNWVSKYGQDRAAVLRKPVKSLAAMYPFAAPHPWHPEGAVVAVPPVVGEVRNWDAELNVHDGDVEMADVSAVPGAAERTGSADSASSSSGSSSASSLPSAAAGQRRRASVASAHQHQHQHQHRSSLAPPPPAVGWEVVIRSPCAPELRTVSAVLRTLTSRAARGFALPLILEDQYRPWPASHHDNIILVDRTRVDSASTPAAGPWDVSLFPVVASLLDRVHAGYFRKLDDWHRQCDALLRAVAGHAGVLPVGAAVPVPPPPSVVMCYKQLLKEVVRSQIAMGTAFTVPGFWDGGAPPPVPVPVVPVQQQAMQMQVAANGLPPLPPLPPAPAPVVVHRQQQREGEEEQQQQQAVASR